MVCAPAAIFLLMMDEAISGMDGTVPVTSRRAYNFPSAGARSPLWPESTIPIFETWSKNSCLGQVNPIPGDGFQFIEGATAEIPDPRPDIFATFRPQAATRGSTTRVVLSPTPPVECLSTALPMIGVRSKYFSGMCHSQGQVGRFLVVHPLQEYGHTECGSLVIRDLVWPYSL